jgi:hypothetical protein
MWPVTGTWAELPFDRRAGRGNGGDADSTQYKEDRKIGDKYATFRIFAVQDLPQ